MGVDLQRQKRTVSVLREVASGDILSRPYRSKSGELARRFLSAGHEHPVSFLEELEEGEELIALGEEGSVELTDAGRSYYEENGGR